MDSFVKNPGYMHLTRTIFEALDKKSLLKCRIVCKSFQVIIDNQTSLWWRLLADSIEEQQLNAVDDEESMEEQEKWQGVLSTIQEVGNPRDIKNAVISYRQYQQKSRIPRYVFGFEFFPLTPLKFSILAGNFHTFQLFVLYGQDTDEHVNDYESLMELAFARRQQNIVNYLIMMMNNNYL